MKAIQIDYEPRDLMKPYHARTQRWACIVAHRRFGKTVGVVNDLIKACARCKKREPRFAYVAPFYAQAKDIVWTYLRQFTAPIPGVHVSESELWVGLPNGGRVRLYGADNYNRMRGIYLDGVAIDEPADMNPRVWPEVIRPALSDRNGWATFIGTPKGRNAFYQIHAQALTDPEWFSLVLPASKTGILPPHELESARRSMSEEQYQREYEVNFDAPVPGAYWGKEMMRLRADGRYCAVPFEPALPVYTVWDLGVDDCAAIWFVQFEGMQVRLIDYYEARDEGLPHYIDVLRQRGNAGYKYGGHFTPHDSKKREFQTGISTIELARKMGFEFQLVPLTERSPGIELARKLLARCLIDNRRCQQGVAALESYTKEYVEERGIYKDTPLHNWASHGADAFRYLAVALESNLIRDNAIASTHIRRDLPQNAESAFSPDILGRRY